MVTISVAGRELIDRATESFEAEIAVESFSPMLDDVASTS